VSGAVDGFAHAFYLAASGWAVNRRGQLLLAPRQANFGSAKLANGGVDWWGTMTASWTIPHRSKLRPTRWTKPMCGGAYLNGAWREQTEEPNAAKFGRGERIENEKPISSLLRF
jgi:hypothetical protein